MGKTLRREKWGSSLLMQLNRGQTTKQLQNAQIQAYKHIAKEENSVLANANRPISVAIMWMVVIMNANCMAHW